LLRSSTSFAAGKSSAMKWRKGEERIVWEVDE
jgi:hypothetical protein